MPSSFVDLAACTAQDLRDLRSRCRDVRRGLAPALGVRAPVALLCGAPAPHTRAAVEAACALLGLRVSVYGPAEVAELGEPALAGARLRALTSAVVGIGLPAGMLAAIDTCGGPVVNAGDAQGDAVGALADLVVLEQILGGWAGHKLAWVGDSSGLLGDLLVGGCTLGLSVAVAHPVGFAPDAERLTAARERAAVTGAAVMVTNDLTEALADASAVYVDPWPADATERFRPFTVHRHSLRHTRTQAVVMHRAPERRGQEVATSLVEDPAWLAPAQARARADAAAALLWAAIHPDPLRSMIG